MPPGAAADGCCVATRFDVASHGHYGAPDRHDNDREALCAHSARFDDHDLGGQATAAILDNNDRPAPHHDNEHDAGPARVRKHADSEGGVLTVKLLTIVRWPQSVDGMGVVDIAHNRVESWECPRCAVRWRSDDPTCWLCGEEVAS